MRLGLSLRHRSRGLLLGLFCYRLRFLFRSRFALLAVFTVTEVYLAEYLGAAYQRLFLYGSGIGGLLLGGFSFYIVERYGFVLGLDLLLYVDLLYSLVASELVYDQVIGVVVYDRVETVFESDALAFEELYDGVVPDIELPCYCVYS